MGRFLLQTLLEALENSNEKNNNMETLPAPQIRTASPIVIPARRQACTPTDKGSSNAPSSKLTESGNLS